MIIIKIKGGLGNQMFQYAFGKKIAFINQTNLILDTRNGFLNDPYKRKFGLNHFNVNVEFTSKLLSIILGIQNFVYRIFNKFEIIPTNNNKFIKEMTNRFDSTFLRQYDKTIYFDGYWQSEKYFSDIKDLIIREFSFKNNFSEKINKIAEDIKSCNSVSIHFRNYDNFTNGKFDKCANSIYSKCSSEYYHSAIKYIRNNNDNIKLFVFSESPIKISNIINFNIPIMSVIGNKDYEDLYLMSLCKNNIIANSSFSWWGAWLNKNNDKIIIAPSNWYKDPLIDTCDLIPNNWIKL